MRAQNPCQPTARQACPSQCGIGDGKRAGELQVAHAIERRPLKRRHANAANERDPGVLDPVRPEPRGRGGPILRASHHVNLAKVVVRDGQAVEQCRRGAAEDPVGVLRRKATHERERPLRGAKRVPPAGTNVQPGRRGMKPPDGRPPPQRLPKRALPGRKACARPLRVVKRPTHPLVHCPAHLAPPNRQTARRGTVPTRRKNQRTTSAGGAHKKRRLV